ncbi:guanine nucleotide binding protein, alpha subunit [Meredithblackwellia eburnea MCA 4105]
MGCAGSTPEDEHTRSIDKELEKEKLNRTRTTTIFMCGTGESGKSTIVKQFRLKYDAPYSKEDRVEFRSIILSNTIQSMVAVLDAMPDFEIKLASHQELDWSNQILDEQHTVGEQPSESFIASLGNLCKTLAVKECLKRSSEFQLNDSAPYFFENFERFSRPDFLPTDDDILRSRVRTVGIREERFNVEGRVFKILDVGGQRSERRKWIACFENVDVLLFVFAINEFDQQLREDETANRFTEAETLFESISNSLWFTQSRLILFLNKIDLFAEKLQRKQLKDFFPGFGQPNTLEFGLDYMQGRVLSLYRGERRPYSHFTQATDTKGTQVILAAVQEQILVNLLKGAFLV